MMLICYSSRSEPTSHQGLSTFFPTGFLIGLEEIQFSHLLAQGEGRHHETSCTLIKEPPPCSWWDALPWGSALDGTWVFEEAAAWLKTVSSMVHNAWPHIVLHALGITSQPRWRVPARMHQECRHIQCLCLSQHTICKLNMHRASWLFFLRLQNCLCCLCPLKATIASCSQKMKWH